MNFTLCVLQKVKFNLYIHIISMTVFGICFINQNHCVQLHTCVMPSVACIYHAYCKLQPGCNLVCLFPWTLGRKLKNYKKYQNHNTNQFTNLRNQVTELHKINALLYVATQPSQSKNMYEVNMTKERNDPQGVVDMTYGSTKNLQKSIQN